jgi:hypothetical protein
MARRDECSWVTRVPAGLAWDKDHSQSWELASLTLASPMLELTFPQCRCLQSQCSHRLSVSLRKLNQGKLADAWNQTVRRTEQGKKFVDVRHLLR